MDARLIIQIPARLRARRPPFDTPNQAALIAKGSPCGDAAIEHEAAPRQLG